MNRDLFVNNDEQILPFWIAIGGPFAILSLLPFSNLATERRCQALEILTSIFVAVAAGVISHYICKWLDGHGKGK